MNGISNLRAISDFFSKEIDEAPEHIAAFYTPANPNNITHQDVKNIIAASSRTSEWVEGYLIPQLEETDEKIKELEETCENLKQGMRKFERKHATTFYMYEGLYFIFNSVCALVVNAKTNAIMIAVLFKERVWSDHIYNMPTYAKNAAYNAGDYALRCLYLRD